jgi:hypothetical protein
MLKVASDTVGRRVRASRDVLAAYLSGSLLGEDFVLGNTADIDLVFIYTEQGQPEREIVRLTDDVHLDIANHYHRDYRDTRRLRVHPWLGPALNACKILYDPQHFMDFTQASVRGQFDRADHVFERARQHVEQARRIWMSYQLKPVDAQPEDVLAYLRAVSHAANAVASLSGPPLVERRFLLQFPARAEAVGRPGLYAGLLGLLGAPNLQPGQVEDWLGAWRDAYESLPAADAPARLHPDRLMYYLAALHALASGSQPETALWPLLHTWTMAVQLLPANLAQAQAWQTAFTRLGLCGAAFLGRLDALDAYLDVIDETLEAWARANGAWQGG